MQRSRSSRSSRACHAVGYIRVSTEEQATEGVSLAAQQAALQAYATMRGLELIEVIRDAGVSGAKPLAQRGGGQKLLTLVKRRTVHDVITWKLDRLFRDCADCLTVVGAWDKASIALHLVDLGGQAVDTSTAVGRFFLTIMAGAAELERNQIRERTSAAMRHKATRREFTGGEVPYGWALAEDGVHLRELPGEQRAVGAAIALSTTGLSLRRICAELQSRDLRPRQGTSWHPQQVKRLLERAA